VEHNNLLSICIPTYNRVESLKETLPDLISKIRNYNIAIYISDNASTDKTEDYITTLQSDYPFIFYKKNISNLGPDKNTENVLKFSTTKYRWLLADHYILTDKTSVNHILPLLKEDYTAIIVNYKNRKIIRDTSYIYTDKNMFLEELGWYIGMMCTTIYHEETIMQATFENFNNSSFLQSLVLLNYISMRKFKIAWVPEEVTWAFSVKGSKSWHADVLPIFAQSWTKNILNLHSFDKKSKKICIKRHAAQVNLFSDKNILLFRYIDGISFFKMVKYLRYLPKVTTYDKITKMFLVCIIPSRFIPMIWKNQQEFFKRVLGGVECYQQKLFF